VHARLCSFQLPGWATIGGAVAIVIFAWNIAGRELVSLSAQTVSVRREVWKVGVTRTYDVEHVSHLRVDGAGINIFDPRAAFAFWGLGGGRVALTMARLRFVSGIASTTPMRVTSLSRLFAVAQRFLNPRGDDSRGQIAVGATKHGHGRQISIGGHVPS